jgi:hypothetical protein
MQKDEIILKQKDFIKRSNEELGIIDDNQEDDVNARAAISASNFQNPIDQ